MCDEVQEHGPAGPRSEVTVENVPRGDRDSIDRYLELADAASDRDTYSSGYIGFGSKVERLAAAHALAALAKHQARDLAGARAEFERAVGLAPGFTATYRIWAIAEAAAGDCDRADELMQKAAALAPTDASLWFHWANIDRKLGRIADARSRLLRALELSPDDAPILVALGMVEKMAGQFEQSVQLLLRALERKPEQPGLERLRIEVICCTALAGTYLQWAEKLEKCRQHDLALDRYQEAFYHANRAVELDPDARRAIDARVEVALSYYLAVVQEQGFTRARPLLERAIVLNPAGLHQRQCTMRACYILVRKLVRLGRREEAERYFEIGSRAARVLDGFYADKFRELVSPLAPKVRGTLTWVAPSGNIGVLEADGTPRHSVTLFRTELGPDVSQDDLRGLVGRSLTFRVKKGPRGAEAREVHLRPSEGPGSGDVVSGSAGTTTSS